MVTTWIFGEGVWSNMYMIDIDKRGHSQVCCDSYGMGEEWYVVAFTW